MPCDRAPISDSGPSSLRLDTGHPGDEAGRLGFLPHGPKRLDALSGAGAASRKNPPLSPGVLYRKLSVSAAVYSRYGIRDAILSMAQMQG